MWYSFIIGGYKMKKIFIFIGILFISILSIFVLFLSIETIRLYGSKDSKPLVILDSYTLARLDNEGDIIKRNRIDKSLGFSMNYEVDLDKKRSSVDNLVYKVNSKEFKLFNKISIWKWNLKE